MTYCCIGTYCVQTAAWLALLLNKLNEDEMGGACSKYGERQTCAGFWWGVDEQGYVER
jgi:hypothetical protein